MENENPIQRLKKANQLLLTALISRGIIEVEFPASLSRPPTAEESK